MKVRVHFENLANHNSVGTLLYTREESQTATGTVLFHVAARTVQEMLLSYSGRAKYTLYSSPSYSCTIMSSTLTCFLTIHVVSTHLESLAGSQHQHTLAHC